MGGGDLNMKKSWHPVLLKNQEKVWLKEKEALEEKKKLDQLRKEKEEERQLQELQRLQEEQTGKKRQEKLEWMYATPATGNSQNTNDLEDYLLGKKRVDKMLTADDNAKLGASHKNFIAVQNANSARDIQAKIREDPLLAIKQQEQAAYQALMSNPLRLREMQERNGIKPKKDKHERNKKKEERKRLKAERKHRRDSRSPSPRDRRQLQSPYERRRSPIPNAQRSTSRDRGHHRLLRHDSYRYTPDFRRRSYSRSPMRNDRVRERERNLDSSHGRRGSISPYYIDGRNSDSWEADDRRFHSKEYHADRSPPPKPCQSSPPKQDVKTLSEVRNARLAAMASNATNMQSERKRRLAELLEKEKAELVKEESERTKSAKSGGIGGFMNSDYKKVYGEGGLEDRIRRTRGTLVID